MLILLDIHDTLANVVSYHPGDPWKDAKLQARFARANSSYWAKRKLTNEATQIVESCIEHAGGVRNVVLCTKLSTPMCAKGTYEWVEKHFPCFKNQIVMCHDKSLLGSERRVLIDDSEFHCRGFEVAGGDSILVPKPWNRNAGADIVGHIDSMLSFFKGRSHA
jgi:hypothetical protein